MPKHVWQTLGLSTLAGFRSMTPLSLLSSNLLTYHPQALAGSPLRLLQKPVVAHGLKLLAASEMAGDKHPNMPDRTVPAAGAFVGATLFTVNRSSWLQGALLGAAAAVAGTYGSYYLRRQATQSSGWSGAVVGGLEDALTLAMGLAVSKGTHAGQPQPRRWAL